MGRLNIRMYSSNELNQAYRTLGISPGAPFERVRRAHRGLMLTWHPDLPVHNGSAGRRMLAEERSKQINAAFAEIIRFERNPREYRTMARRQMAARKRGTQLNARFLKQNRIRERIRREAGFYVELESKLSWVFDSRAAIPYKTFRRATEEIINIASISGAHVIAMCCIVAVLASTAFPAYARLHYSLSQITSPSGLEKTQHISQSTRPSKHLGSLSAWFEDIAYNIGSRQ